MHIQDSADPALTLTGTTPEGLLVAFVCLVLSLHHVHFLCSSAGTSQRCFVRTRVITEHPPGTCRQDSGFLHLSSSFYIRKCSRGFPGGAVVESLPANAVDTGLSPGLGGSHMPRSNQAREPQLLSLCVWSLCSATREAATLRGPRTAMKSGPRTPQVEEALAQKRGPNAAKNKIIN